VALAVDTVAAFGLCRGVLHVEGKCTSRGPRLVEVNARLAGGRIWEMVRAVWDVDLVEAQLRACLDLAPAIKPARRPRCAVVNTIMHAPSTGRLAALPVGEIPPSDCIGLDVNVQAGDLVQGPEHVFATVLGSLVVRGPDLASARATMARALKDPPLVE
jgi:carnosine synthase